MKRNYVSLYTSSAQHPLALLRTPLSKNVSEALFPNKLVHTIAHNYWAIKTKQLSIRFVIRDYK